MPLPLVASTAVAWHRLLIDGQRVTGGSRLGFGPVERRYAGAALVLLGYMLVPLLMVVCVQLAVRDSFRLF